jgi:hypothetical protein
MVMAQAAAVKQLLARFARLFWTARRARRFRQPIVPNEFFSRKSLHERALAECFRGDADTLTHPHRRKHLQAFARIRKQL